MYICISVNGINMHACVCVCEVQVRMYKTKTLRIPGNLCVLKEKSHLKVIKVITAAADKLLF